MEINPDSLSCMQIIGQGAETKVKAIVTIAGKDYNITYAPKKSVNQEKVHAQITGMLKHLGVLAEETGLSKGNISAYQLRGEKFEHLDVKDKEWIRDYPATLSARGLNNKYEALVKAQMSAVRSFEGYNTLDPSNFATLKNRVSTEAPKEPAQAKGILIAHRRLVADNSKSSKTDEIANQVPKFETITSKTVDSDSVLWAGEQSPCMLIQLGQRRPDPMDSADEANSSTYGDVSSVPVDNTNPYGVMPSQEDGVMSSQEGHYDDINLPGDEEMNQPGDLQIGQPTIPEFPDVPKDKVLLNQFDKECRSIAEKHIVGKEDDSAIADLSDRLFHLEDDKITIAKLQSVVNDLLQDYPDTRSLNNIQTAIIES